mmetsp:Transcript_20008/g.34026  ORF Transcript_20008/g.34026 Transcript_20008/m.34026 type:complete len:547 (+) Transcript_20008:86-1726(+)
MAQRSLRPPPVLTVNTSQPMEESIGNKRGGGIRVSPRYKSAPSIVKHRSPQSRTPRFKNSPKNSIDSKSARKAKKVVKVTSETTMMTDNSNLTANLHESQQESSSSGSDAAQNVVHRSESQEFDDNALELGMLLSSQRDKFGISMFEFLRTKDPSGRQLKELMDTGLSRPAAALKIFETHFDISDTQISSSSDTHNMAQHLSAMSVAEVGSLNLPVETKSPEPMLLTTADADVLGSRGPFRKQESVYMVDDEALLSEADVLEELSRPTGNGTPALPAATAGSNSNSNSNSSSHLPIMEIESERQQQHHHHHHRHNHHSRGNTSNDAQLQNGSFYTSPGGSHYPIYTHPQQQQQQQQSPPVPVPYISPPAHQQQQQSRGMHYTQSMHRMNYGGSPPAPAPVAPAAVAIHAYNLRPRASYGYPLQQQRQYQQPPVGLRYTQSMYPHQYHPAMYYRQPPGAAAAVPVPVMNAQHPQQYQRQQPLPARRVQSFVQYPPAPAAAAPVPAAAAAAAVTSSTCTVYITTSTPAAAAVARDALHTIYAPNELRW